MFCVRVSIEGPPDSREGSHMHELALMDDLVAHISEQVRDRVIVVRLELGRDSCVSPDALRFCFDVCAKETVLEGASLDILAIEGNAMRLKEIEVT